MRRPLRAGLQPAKGANTEPERIRRAERWVRNFAHQYHARRLGIELVDARRTRTKGKIERLFRFIQRDFILEELDATSVAAVNAAFAQWIGAYNFGHASQALDGEAPAAHYVPSTRRLRPEELELLLVQEEPRKVARTGTISYNGRHYRVPEAYIGRRVWTSLKGDCLTRSGGPPWPSISSITSPAAAGTGEDNFMWKKRSF